SWSCRGSIVMRTGGRIFEFVFAGHQLAAQKLADWRFWNIGDEDVAARTLEIGETRGAAELVEFGARHRCGAFDGARASLAPAGRCDLHHRHFRHGGPPRWAAFDLHGGFVLAAGNDHVVNPTGYEQIPVGVEISRVTGQVPAVEQGLSIGFRPLPVALE